MLRPFPNWPSSSWNTISEELYTYYKRRHQYQCFFCTHTNTDVYTYSRYIVPLTLYSNLMMASQETTETCSWYVIVHTNIVVFLDCYSLIIDLPQFKCSLFSQKIPIIRILCILGWLAVPLNLDTWSCTVILVYLTQSLELAACEHGTTCLQNLCHIKIAVKCSFGVCVELGQEEPLRKLESVFSDTHLTTRIQYQTK